MFSKKAVKFSLLICTFIILASCANFSRYTTTTQKFVNLEYKYKQMLSAEFLNKDVIKLEGGYIQVLNETPSLIQEAKIDKDTKRVEYLEKMQKEIKYKLVILSDLKD